MARGNRTPGSTPDLRSSPLDVVSDRAAGVFIALAVWASTLTSQNIHRKRNAFALLHRMGYTRELRVIIIT